MKRMFAALLVFAVLATACGCGKKDEKNSTAEVDATVKKTETKKEPSDGIISVFSYKPDTFCPILSNNEANVQMLEMIFDSLITLGDDMQPKAKLAESWSASKDGKQWTLKLKNGVVWQDSSAFSAEDVVYTVRSIMAHTDSCYAANTANIAAVKAEGADSVVFTLKTPNPCFINLLYFPIVKNGSIGADLQQFSPIGTGAYMLEDRNEGNVYYLAENPSWWGGKPACKLIKVRMLPDKDTALYAFGSENIDIAAAENSDWGKYVDATESSYAQIKTPVYHFVGINNKNSILSENGVRSALSYAINRKEIRETVFLSGGVSVNAPIRPEWYVYGSQTEDFRRDLNAAKKELEDCGWELVDNSYYRKKSGRKSIRLKLDILINEDNADRENISQIIQNNFGEMGIETTVTKVPFEEYEKRIANGKFDLFIGSCVIPSDMDLSFLLGDGNLCRFEDDEMKFVLDELKTKSDKNGIIESYAEIINLFNQLNPMLGLAFRDKVMIYGNRIEGEVKPSYYNIYNGIEKLVKK